jgi:CBS-domain-containing membrane protein
MRRFITLHQPRNDLRKTVLAGLGGAVAIGFLGFLTISSGHALLMAPFGASCVLLFSVPASPLSQPMNVIGGHVVSTLVGLLLRLYLPNEWWAVAIAVGLAISFMALFRVTHPPAGADPIIVFVSDPGFTFLLLPVLAGAVGLVAIAAAFHVTTSTNYPLNKPS